MKVVIVADELYPFFDMFEPKTIFHSHKTVDIPDTDYDRILEVMAQFWAVQEELRAYAGCEE